MCRLARPRHRHAFHHQAATCKLHQHPGDCGSKAAYTNQPSSQCQFCRVRVLQQHLNTTPLQGTCHLRQCSSDLPPKGPINSAWWGTFWAPAKTPDASISSSTLHTGLPSTQLLLETSPQSLSQTLEGQGPLIVHVRVHFSPWEHTWWCGLK